MLTYQGRKMGAVEVNDFSKGGEATDVILFLRTKPITKEPWAKDINQLLKEEEEEGWKMEYFHGGPMKLALLYRLGARKFSFPEDLSKVDAEPLQLLRALGVKTDIVDPVLQMKIVLRLKQKETVLALLKKDPALLHNPDIFSSISDQETLQALLEAGLDAKDEKLMEAVINKGDGAMLRTLLTAGATLQNPNKTLEKVMKRGDHKGADFILALIDAGANADALNTLSVEIIPYGYKSLTYENSATLLHRAADEVNLTDVQLLLAHGANPNAPGKKTKDDQKEPYGMTPLMAAANSAMSTKDAVNRTEIVKRLLEAGADVHAKDSAGNGVIYYAVCGGTREITYDECSYRVSKKAEADILSMVELLIKAGADVPKDILLRRLRPEISPAGREKLALMLLDAGAAPLVKSENKWTNGWTTLMVNGIWGGKIAKRLLDAGVDPTVKCGETSAMTLAMKEGAVEVVKLLKERGIDPGELQVVEPEKLEPLLKLGARIPKDMTNSLLGNILGFSGVYHPCHPYEDYVDIIQILKRHGYTPNLIAWTQEKSVLHKSDFNEYVLRAFFKTGENPNEVDENGDSLLFHFLSTKKFDLPAREMARALPIFREAGADFNHKNKAGNSLLTNLASSNAWIVNGVLPAFIEAGGDVNKPINQDGQTPLFYAEDAETIAQLLRAGADAHVRDTSGRTPLFPCHIRRNTEAVRLLMQRGVRINAQDNDGNTALMIAVTRNESSSVQALLDAGADPNIKNKAGKTTLQIAQENKSYYRKEIVKLLKEHGAKEETVALPSEKKSAPSNEKKNDPNEKDARGRTRLMLAVLKKGSEGEIQSLLRQGADVNARDNKGNTALHYLLTVVGNIDARLNALLAAHPDVNLATHKGTTPLMILDVCRNHGERVSRVKKLLELHAKVDLKDAVGKTAAMRYVEKDDNAEALKLLLDAGADPKLRNKDGKTLLQLSQEYKRTACVRLLQDRLTPPSPAKPLPASSSGHLWWYIIGGVLLVLLVGCVGRRLRRKK